MAETKTVEGQAWRAMVATVSLACDRLTDEELAVLYRTALFRYDPATTDCGYEKIKHLFTEKTPEGWPAMHQMAVDALGTVVVMRLEKTEGV